MARDFLTRLPPTWALGFSDNALARGKQYAEEDRVTLLREDDGLIEASCRGTGGKRYRQSLLLDKRGGLSCVCSCPVGLACKHAAAVIHHLQQLAEHAPPGADAAPDGELPDALRHWLAQLPRALGEDTGQDAPAHCLHYRLLPDLYVEVNKVRLRQDGSVAAREPYPAVREATFRQPRFMQPLDLHIAALLALAPIASNRFALTGENGAEALRLLLESGRAFLDWDAPALQPGHRRAARFAWQQHEGALLPVLEVEGGAEPLTAVDPLYYRDDAANEVGLLEHGLSAPLARHLLEAPAVSPNQAGLFSLSLSEIAPQLPVPTRAEEQRIDDLQPIARLMLGSHQAMNWQPASGRMVNEQQHRAGLSFVYGSLATHGKLKGEQRLRQAEGERVLSIARQPAAEQALRQQLQQLGFRPALRQSPALPKDSAEMFELPSESAWQHFAETQLPLLRQQGWQIVMQPGFAYDLAPVEQWYAELDESPEHSWFDLQLGILVEGERISLLPVLLSVIRRNPALLSPQNLAQRADDETLRVALGRRSALDDRPLQVLLPFGRLKPILATLGELYLRDQPTGDSLRLSRLDAARLGQLDALPFAWSGGEQLLDFARRLRDYSQQPVAAPSGLRATLRPYQLDGLSWMQALRALDVGGILGDDMGLGKTLQTLAHLLLEKQAGRLDRPSLVVMPTSLIPNWQDEAARFTPQLRVLTLHGSDRQRHFAQLGEYDLLLTTYALLPRDIEQLVAQPMHLLVLDEAQNIKNASSKAAQAAGRLVARRRLCLTGTPLENHLGELWSLFHFLMPGWLGDARSFTRSYRTPIEKHGDQDRLQHLVARIRPFLLRRRKEDVARELPPKTEIVHWVDLSPAQRDLYETVRLAMDRKVREEIDRKGLARSQIVILEALLKLRQVCCDLRLVKADSARVARSGHSAKLDSLMQMLDELLAEGRRVLLFSQFTSMLALIEDELRQRDMPYVIITGDTRDRRTPVRQFQNGEVPLFLISLKAGGTGLNLTAADTVIHYDPWWNPAAENQATDRAYRIGQDKPVFVYKLITRGSVEEKIQQLQARKAELASGVLDSGATDDWRLQQSDIDALLAPLPD
ncbi:DEAD/DEAH box helicase [Stutzerimonas degradans]|uniref:DEAD/DEAH box helicase n=1 Tax=Stutzerimonas degradans TaxID=2968968 RepID=UPI0013F4C10A|nr:DEAD/DEAH box helicase [Stutzerimonas degradans]NHC11433.1 DEAD/DEAH box helicase [Stutzerimonas degradans]